MYNVSFVNGKIENGGDLLYNVVASSNFNVLKLRINNEY